MWVKSFLFPWSASSFMGYFYVFDFLLWSINVKGTQKALPGIGFSSMGQSSVALKIVKAHNSEIHNRLIHLNSYEFELRYLKYNHIFVRSWFLNHYHLTYFCSFHFIFRN